jgi:cell wall-associated NlpC family hydrolase
LTDSELTHVHGIKPVTTTRAMMRPARTNGPATLITLLMLGFLATGCATRQTAGIPVPRPFPGAPIPPTSTPADTPAAEPPPAVVAAPPVTPPPEANAIAEPLLATALALAGTPYRNGGSDPSGFDCSGFVQWVFSRHGAALPREVREQYREGDDVDRDDIRPGDLVFFETVSRGASHVGIALGNDQFVHAPSSRGVVRVERYTGSYWASRWVGARRIL